jgi:hypothetical protein
MMLALIIVPVMKANVPLGDGRRQSCEYRASVESGRRSMPLAADDASHRMPEESSAYTLLSFAMYVAPEKKTTIKR